MTQVSSLLINGYRNEPVPNTFWKQDKKVEHLAVIFPGYGYTSDMPLLYYTGHLLFDHGADLLQVQTNYAKNPEYLGLTDEGQAAWLYADSLAASMAGLEQRSYRQLTLVGKSLGTMAIAHLLGDKPEFSQATCLWLTPVLGDPLTYDRILHTDQRSLVVIGTRDHYYQPDKIQVLKQNKNVKVLEVANTNHSLELEGDIPGSIKVMEKVIGDIAAFLYG